MQCGVLSVAKQKISKRTSKKRYYIQYNIGHAKYVVNSHDGKQKHSDGSDFFDIRIFKNKQKLKKYEKELQQKGYSKM